jgi:hypothetical protein
VLDQRYGSVVEHNQRLESSLVKEREMFRAEVERMVMLLASHATSKVQATQALGREVATLTQRAHGAEALASELEGRIKSLVLEAEASPLFPCVCAWVQAKGRRVCVYMETEQ